MANFHSDEWIMARLNEHYDEALTLFPKERILGIFYQGSGNYGLDVENSDVDTKLIVLPTIDEIVFNKKPVSTTHIRENDEHIDLKDVRLYFNTFYKQNLNFLEILFTPYFIVNPEYEDLWSELVYHNEDVARMNPLRGLKSMKGIALEKYHAMEHKYPSKVEVLEKFGYDPKQLHHLVRVYEYIERYIEGEPYKDCLISKKSEELKEIKSGYYSLPEARVIADATINNVDTMVDEYCKDLSNESDPVTKEFLDDLQSRIIKRALTKELLNG